MKKAIGAAVLMVLLFIGAAWNIRYLDQMTENMVNAIELSRQYSHADNSEAAMDTLQAVIRDWNEADWYTHIFIRHAEVDATADSFYEALSALQADEAVDAAYDKLIAHLTSIDTMEHITWKSVF